MTYHQQSVLEFMEIAGKMPPANPTSPGIEERKLCARLIMEEALEMINGGLGLSVFTTLPFVDIEHLDFIEDRTPDLVKLCDGAADTKYVIDWTMNEHGIDNEYNEIEVCRSNLTKFQWNMDELKKAEAAGMKVVIQDLLDDDKAIACVKNSAGKVQKPSTYSKANITIDPIR